MKSKNLIARILVSLFAVALLTTVAARNQEPPKFQAQGGFRHVRTGGC